MCFNCSNWRGCKQVESRTGKKVEELEDQFNENEFEYSDDESSDDELPGRKRTWRHTCVHFVVKYAQSFSNDM